ncbi:hypothetical protein UFOVP58_191 [uncultured Caudovirales phage]|uniref:Uncharacterized protein n=1 Tax=uncultured Caudovirales phage TaxID=2100421 RepID=A0A6J5KT08_9CAUD|nr:hypothetical protein UFOVP58_191 [uncultured Caudovirales phage]
MIGLFHIYQQWCQGKSPAEIILTHESFIKKASVWVDSNEEDLAVYLKSTNWFKYKFDCN